MSRIFSILLDDDTASKLDRLALALDRPQSRVIEHAIAEYIEEQAWRIKAINDALTAYRGGAEVLTPHDEVMDRAEALFAEELVDLLQQLHEVGFALVGNEESEVEQLPD